MDRHKLLIFYFFIRSSVCFTDFCQHLSTASSFFFSFPIYDDRIGPTWGPPTTALGSSFWGFDQNPFLFTVEYNLIQLKKKSCFERDLFLFVTHSSCVSIRTSSSGLYIHFFKKYHNRIALLFTQQHDPTQSRVNKSRFCFVLASVSWIHVHSLSCQSEVFYFLPWKDQERVWDL